ncbi:MAG: bifunctional precorrin-2 dehydrogenase/sirohydrochlorin ferrochelatase [Deltaproteobacteria bacterium]|nr:bifunctional precorrin-2 dehydrogenase/sirohydrochlorin ferrochelatase [Deltaproteobacteria bacterium]
MSPPEPQDEPLFPVFLKLKGRRVLLVGAGPVAAQKYAALREAQANVRVVAPEISPAFAALGTDGAEVRLRAFEPADLDGVYYVVAAAPPAVNRAVTDAAEARCLFVNAVDDLAAATAYACALVRRGPATIAISTGGEAPALAGLLREGFEALMPAEAPDWVAESKRLRDVWRAEKLPLPERRPRLLQAINALYEGRLAKAPQP